MREDALAQRFGKRGVGVHLAVELQVGCDLASGSSAASRIFSALGASREPKSESESSAAFGSMPKRRISSAASTVISAISSAVGSTVT